MAKITYGDELPDDSVGKKFQGAVYDTGSANAIAAVKGVNPVTQQGKTVVDQSVAVSTASGAGAAGGLAADAAVTTDATGTRSAYLRGLVAWFARLGSLDGAAFTAGSSYVWPGLAGVYQSTVGVLTGGQRGLARLTDQRAVITVGDPVTVSLFSAGGGTANPTPWAASTDGTITDTAAHDSPIASTANGPDYRWRRGYMRIYNGCDATATITCYDPSAAVFSTTIAPTSFLIVASATAATGGATVLNVPLFNTPMAGFQMRVQFSGGAPTTGSFVATLRLEV